MSALQYLDTLWGLHPELAEWYNTLADLYQKKPWHQLTLELEKAFNVSGKIKPEEAVEFAISSLPDEVVDTIRATSFPSEDPVSERRRKLEFLEMQEEMIKEEEEKMKVEEEKAKLKESTVSEKDAKWWIRTTREAQEYAKAASSDNDDQLCKLSRALDVLVASASIRIFWCYILMMEPFMFL